jgi:hypothetical protein
MIDTWPTAPGSTGTYVVTENIDRLSSIRPSPPAIPRTQRGEERSREFFALDIEGNRWSFETCTVRERQHRSALKTKIWSHR